MSKTQLEFRIFHLSLWYAEETDTNVKEVLQIALNIYNARLTNVIDQLAQLDKQKVVESSYPWY